MFYLYNKYLITKYFSVFFFTRYSVIVTYLFWEQKIIGANPIALNKYKYFYLIVKWYNSLLITNCYWFNSN